MNWIAKSCLTILIVMAVAGCKVRANEKEIVVDSSDKLPQNIQGIEAKSVKASYGFSDKSGKHVLVLIRSNEKSKDGSERVSLRAVQYLSVGTQWKEEWTIKDFVSCENLDIQAEFLPQLTSITDLDTDGIAETTVAYQVQCAGGIDPIPTKAIMREGDAKYAIRGESIIRIKGVAPFGGDFTPDPTLDKYPVFKTHLVSIWKKAAGIDP